MYYSLNVIRLRYRSVSEMGIIEFMGRNGNVQRMIVIVH